MEILVSGSLAYDRIMDFPGKFSDYLLPEKIHVLNVCFVVNNFTERFGGTAGNIAYSLAMLDERPIILATTGKDFAGYKQQLIQNNLPMDGILEIPEVFTASAYITTDSTDNQITVFNPGAMNYPSCYKFDAIKTADALAIISPGNVEDMVSYSRYYKENGIPYIFDPGQQIPALGGEHLSEIVNGAEILITSDYELEMIMKATGMERADFLESARSMVTTFGEKGSVIVTKDREMEVPAVTAKVVEDPTGAGDAYRAGLLKGLVTNKDLATSARMGSTCASFAVEFQGTQVHRFTLETFWDRYQKAFEDTP